MVGARAEEGRVRGCRNTALGYDKNKEEEER